MEVTSNHREAQNYFYLFSIVSPVTADALSCLSLAADECEKTSNVDVTVILDNCRRCSLLVHQLQQRDTDMVRQRALEQLSQTLAHHEDVLTAKLQQLGQSSSPASSSAPVVPIPTGRTTGPRNSAAEDTKDERSQSRRLAIGDTIVTKGGLCFNDVAGLDGAKQSLKEAIIMPLQFPHLFKGGRKPWKRILLYGPPGTGKSRLAQAVSSEISSTFYSVSSSDLVSSWVGESEKLIKELFVHATSQSGRSVVFIDEIDSICRQRRSAEEEHTRRIKTELLKQMEGADNSDTSDKIFLLCATNCPWELDSAFLRRFQKRIYIPLPDREARVRLMKIHMRDNAVQLHHSDWITLAEQTHGYSGSDIANMVLGALFQPVRDMQNATHWKHTQGGELRPCSSEDISAFKAKLSDLPPDQIQPRDVVLEDFTKSLSTNRNTVTSSELERFELFTKTYGQSG